jgi:mannose-1-phosphate guanylyltransferase
MNLIVDTKYDHILLHESGNKFLIQYMHDKGTLFKWSDIGGWNQIVSVYNSNGRDSAIEELKLIISSFV